MKTESMYEKITSAVRSPTALPPKNLPINAKLAAIINQYSTMKETVDARIPANHVVKEAVAVKLTGWVSIVTYTLVAVAY